MPKPNFQTAGKEFWNARVAYSKITFTKPPLANYAFNFTQSWQRHVTKAGSEKAFETMKQDFEKWENACKAAGIDPIKKPRKKKAS